MIYFFHGSDFEKTRAKAFEWVMKARTKEPNLVYVRLTREDLTPAALDDIALSSGLFVSRLLILIDDPFPAAHASSEEDREEVATGILEEHLDSLAASDNAIIILAPRLAAVKAKKIIERAKMEYKFDAPAARTAKREFNSNLVNALAARSHEKLWLEINRAFRAGDAPEMLHGLLHWKVRSLMDKGNRAWRPGEVRRLSLALIGLLQESRRGGLGLSLALERFALTM
ncbi:MAG TPA: hypothetical protein VNF51_03395 [Candidatus Paceibacterota bacterium]|nr:hypothetical protein [Candidatus Paceibacterota bacterium]